VALQTDLPSLPFSFSFSFSLSISEVDDIGSCVELVKVDLSGNEIKSLQGLAHTKGIKWLKATGNKISSMADLTRLINLNGITTVTAAVTAAATAAAACDWTGN